MTRKELTAVGWDEFGMNECVSVMGLSEKGYRS
jgi:hypothetical protein